MADTSFVGNTTWSVKKVNPLTENFANPISGEEHWNAIEEQFQATKDLDLSAEMQSGDAEPEAVAEEIEAAVEEEAAAATAPDRPAVNYNAIDPSRPHRKLNYGVNKSPVAAEFRIESLAKPSQPVVARSSKFFLGGVSYEKSENSNFSKGFDEDYLFTVFGKNPMQISITGLLLNLAGDQDWVQAMNDFYDNYLRAYQLVQYNQIAVLIHSNRRISGYPIAFNASYDSGSEVTQPFNIGMIVRRDRFVGSGL